MTIEFTVKKDKGYFITTITGLISNNELIEAYKSFFNSPDFSADLNELTDLSNVDLNQITPDGLKKLSSLIKSTSIKFNWHPYVAVYAPTDLTYGLARLYSVKAEDFETHLIVRQKKEAIAWLEQLTAKK